MDEQLAALLEAHVAYELRQWRGRALERHIDAETGAFREWAETVTLAGLLDVETARSAVRRLALERPLPDELAATLAALVRHLLRLRLHRETTVNEVVDQAVFEEGVALAADLEDARTALIRGAADNPVYAAFASELLYHGIKDYLFSDQALLKRIPGVSALVSAGTSAVNRSMPGLEAQVEKRVRAYIESNLTRTLRNSEELLLQSLTAERIRALGDELWENLAETPMAVDHALGERDIDALVGYGHTLWQQLRETEYVDALVVEAVDRLYELHGDDSLATLMGRLGLGETYLAEQAHELLPPLLDTARDSGALEALIRRRLRPFYRSKAAASALGKN